MLPPSKLPGYRDAKIVLRDVINPSLEALVDYTGIPWLASDDSKRRLIEIGLQESRFKHNRQLIDVDKGPGVDLQPRGVARGPWQCEPKTLRSVVKIAHRRLLHADALFMAYRITDAHLALIVDTIENDRHAACIMARLLLWCDPKPIDCNTPSSSWNLYKRVWGPGKPWRDTWNNFHRIAMALVPCS